jgi:hypothetical protein
MRTTAEYLNTLTVKVLKGMCKDMGLKGYSSLRKAEIVLMLSCEMNIQHGKALDTVKVRTPKYTISLMDYPVPYGRPVTEQHTRICAERGHVSYVNNGVDTGICPRCGENKNGSALNSFLTELHNTLKSFVMRAEEFENNAYASNLPADETDSIAEQWTTVAKDLNKALGNVMWSQAYHAEKTHTCDLNLREVGLSGCAYGCRTAQSNA